MSDTGATLPGLGSTEDRDGKVAWTDPTNIQAEANYAYVNLTEDNYGDWLRASQFGFAIGAGNTIKGVVVEISRCTSSNTGNAMYDSSLRLVNASGNNEGNEKAKADVWPATTPATASYGGALDTWGVSLTPAIVNDADFGIRLSVYKEGATTRAARVYWVKITVYYEAAGWANISKVNGIASSSISKVNDIAVASISKVNGVAV